MQHKALVPRFSFSLSPFSFRCVWGVRYDACTLSKARRLKLGLGLVPLAVGNPLECRVASSINGCLFRRYLISGTEYRHLQAAYTSLHQIHEKSTSFHFPQLMHYNRLALDVPPFCSSKLALPPALCLTWTFAGGTPSATDTMQ